MERFDREFLESYKGRRVSIQADESLIRAFLSDIEEEQEEQRSQQQRQASQESQWRTALYLLCSRLALNDDTIVDLHQEDLLGEGSGAHFDWTDQDFFVLGVALTDHMHLQLTLAVPKELCFEWEHARGTSELRQAVMTMPRLHTLRLVQVCCRAQTCLLQGAALSKSLRYLTITDEWVDTRTLATLFGNHQPLPKLPTPVLTSFCTAVPRDLPPNTMAVCHLTHLTLTRCKFGDLHMLDLSLGLAHNHSLLSLSITHAFINSVGIVYFCQHWSEDSPLEELDLSYNCFGATGVHHLLIEAYQHAALQHLVTCKNKRRGRKFLEEVGPVLLEHSFSEMVDILQSI
jgi:hypothetical protein